MADKKIKVWNRSKGIHHFVFSDGKKFIPISPGGFAMIPEDEIYHVNYSSKSFSKGIIEIDESHKKLREDLGFDKRNPNAISMKEIEDLLNQKLTNEIKAQFDGISERHAFDKIIEVARKLDLTQSKIDFIEEITGMKVVNELEKEEKKLAKKSKETK